MQEGCRNAFGTLSKSLRRRRGLMLLSPQLQLASGVLSAKMKPSSVIRKLDDFSRIRLQKKSVPSEVLAAGRTKAASRNHD